MHSIRIESHFSAAHNLRGYRGRCEKLHGHNWKVEVQIGSSRLNKLAMVCDFKEARKKLEKVLKGLDHSHLNNLAYFKKNNPTSEKIAEFIYNNLKKSFKTGGLILQQVTVWETERAQASFSEGEL